jgi:hypothetical protein
MNPLRSGAMALSMLALAGILIPGLRYFVYRLRRRAT